MKYNKYKIKECLKKIIDNRGRNPKYYDKEKYLVIDNYLIKNTLYPNMNNVNRFIDENTYNNFLRGYTEVDMPIITLVGNGIGNVTLIPDKDIAIVQNTIGFETNERLDKIYFYYWLLYNQTTLRNLNRGTSQPSIKKTDIENMEIYLPEKNIQIKSAKILNILDKKIEQNTAANNNLYDIASKLYEEKFITCRNEEWNEYKLIDIADIVNGYSYKGTELVNDSSIGMATIKNFDRNGGFKEDGFKPLNPNKVKDSQYIEKFDVVVACTDLTQNADIIGNANLLLSKEKYEKIIISMDLVKIVPNSDIIDNFMIYSILNSQEFKKFALGYTSGTTVLHLNKNCFKDYIIKLPGKTEIDNFIKTVKPIYIKISQIMEENKVLEKLRDTLLPKLMNGEIDLENVEI